MSTNKGIDPVILEAGVLMFSEIAKDSASAAYLISLGFLRAAERAAGGKPLTDPNRPELVDKIVDAVADMFKMTLPGLHAVDPPEPPAKA